MLRPNIRFRDEPEITVAAAVSFAAALLVGYLPTRFFSAAALRACDTGRVAKNSSATRIETRNAIQTYTSSRSAARPTSAYNTGIKNTLISNLVNNPLTITSANGRCESVPTPVASATGSNPNAATSAVIMIGLNRRIAP
jgi:hypothetical protein